MFKLFLMVVVCYYCVSSAQPETEFVPISGPVPHDITGVVLPAFCDANSQIVQTLTTIEPSEEDGLVSVLTYPPNLVTVSTQSGVADDAIWLLLTFNQTVATSAQEGGVRIQIPPAQFQRIDACCSARAQILSGFTNVKSVLASTSASIQADLTSGNNGSNSTNTTATTSTTKDLDILASTSATISVNYEGGHCNIISVGTSGSIHVSAKSVTKVMAETSGSILADLDTPPVSGSATTSGTIQVNVPGGCDNLGTKSSGTCTVNEDLIVQVPSSDTEEGGDTTTTTTTIYTRSGNETCPIGTEQAPTTSSGASTSSNRASIIIRACSWWPTIFNASQHNNNNLSLVIVVVASTMMGVVMVMAALF